MNQTSEGLAFVPFDPTAGKRGSQRAREIRIHAGKVGWKKSSKAAQIEARKKKELDPKVGRKQDETEHGELIPRPFASAFGGVSLKTFDAGEDGISKQIGYLMLSAVWPNVVGDAVAPECRHVRASIALARRLGGPKALQLPGLGYMAAFTDLFFASCHLRKPLVPECFWDDVNLCDVMPEELCRPALESNNELPLTPGAGFGNLPGGLPSTALSVFTEVAYIDRILAVTVIQAHPTNPIQQARLATCHKLLSLPTWDELDDESSTCRNNDYTFYPESTSKCHRAIYEICRLTCIICSNACFFPLPPHNGWNTRLTSRAIELLEMANFDMWCSDVDGLYLWALFICGMAAYDTPNRPWFEDRLANLAHSRQICVEHALNQARRFVWTDSVCEVGARELWDAAMTSQPTSQEDVKYVMEWGQL